MMSSIVLKVKIMVMKEGALEGTLARPALRRTAAMVFNRSAQINLPIGTFLVLSFQQTFTERMAAFSSACKDMRYCSILPKFSFPSSLMAIKIDIHKASDV